MELFIDKHNCCGCSACAEICPQKAIEMVEDDEGFLYPKIDDSLCVDCGLCKSNCAFQNGYIKNSIISSYGLVHKSAEKRKNSRSGAAFILISDAILELGGTVYGASLNDDFTVSHKRATNEIERDEFKGSKYVQSVIGKCFDMVLDDLKKDKYVMFSGTSCQVAGLLSYLSIKNIDKTKLFTVDLVCHGVPSNKLWLDYLEYSKLHFGGKKITKVDFRDKEFGWSKHYESIWIDDNKFSSKKFALLFYENCLLRPSCYNCKYSNVNRPSDFTLADFWGINNLNHDFDVEKGVSLLLMNTEKANNLFNKVKEKSKYLKVETKDFIVNPNLRHPTIEPTNRKKFWQMYNKMGFKKTTDYYLLTRNFKRLIQIITKRKYIFSQRNELY